MYINMSRIRANDNVKTNTCKRVQMYLVGSIEGSVVGSVVGSKVGLTVGRVGYLVGYGVGSVVGLDGAPVGELVGYVGIIVGSAVGSAVGSLVGSVVGSLVGIIIEFELSVASDDLLAAALGSINDTISSGNNITFEGGIEWSSWILRWINGG